jgi:hypothetical protein
MERHSSGNRGVSVHSCLEQSIPAELANFLKRLEQRNDEPEAMSRRLC